MQQSTHAHRPVTRTEIAYAGFWRRCLAYLIDGVVLGAVGGGLGAGVLLFDPGDYKALFNAVLVLMALGWAYSALLESSPARGTLGKIALELFVGDAHGDPITFWRASVRYWLKSLSSLFLMLGWLMAAFTPRKQALHDLLAGTLVLRRVKLLVIGQEPPTEPGEYWDGTRWVATITPPLSMEKL
jgi:uncharacterized RDD family membrane protein YckC